MSEADNFCAYITMNERNREERAIWKLREVGYRVQRRNGHYVVANSEKVTELEDLAQLIAFANALYADHWVGRKIILSA